MKVNQNKLILLIVLVAIIIFILLICYLILKNKKRDSIPEYIFIDNLAPERKLAEKESSNKKYIIIDNCVNKIIKFSQENNTTGLYSLLDNEYITNNNINQNNIVEKLGFNKIKTYRIVQLYVDRISDTFHNYNIEIITDIGNIYIRIHLDITNSTFSFTLLSNEEFTESITTLNNNTIKTIEKNEYNYFSSRYFTKDEVVEKYFYDYIKCAIEFPEIAYNNLDEEYRNLRFGNLEEFEKYVSNNQVIKDIYQSRFTDFLDYNSFEEYWISIKHVGLEKYRSENYNDHTRYICIDSYDNYYIFDVTTMMNYALILDTYTIDLPEFLEKYNEANEQEKVILNLNKINLALNARDYKYVYNKLADSYKTKNFPTLESFEKYVKTNLFDKNIFDYLSFGDEVNGNYYTYNVDITDETENSFVTVNKTFIMQLRRWNRFYNFI